MAIGLVWAIRFSCETDLDTTVVTSETEAVKLWAIDQSALDALDGAEDCRGTMVERPWMIGVSVRQCGVIEVQWDKLLAQRRKCCKAMKRSLKMVK
jgi:hypothetical protein